MQYVTNGRAYWTVRVGGYEEAVPMQDGEQADYYVYREHPSPMASVCVGYLARVRSSGTWRAYDDKGARLSDQDHMPMALADVAIAREVRGAAMIAARSR